MNELENELIDTSIDLLFTSLPDSPLKDMQDVIINEIAINGELRNRLLRELMKYSE